MLPGATIMGKAKSHELPRPESSTVWIYLCFAAMCSAVWQALRGAKLSTLPTLSVGLQVLAMLFLQVKVMKTRSVGGISAKSLKLQATVHVLRLAATLWMKGYLPTDITGNWFYQSLDFLTLLLCLHILYSVHTTYWQSYQADADSFAIAPLFGFCAIAAMLVHPDLNGRPFWDVVWTTSLYVDCTAMLPQLWMLTKIGGDVEGLTGHYVASVAVSRMVNLAFWYCAFKELAPLDGGFNFPGYAVFSVQVVQSLLMCDFMFYYVRANLGLRAGGMIQLPTGGISI